MPLNYIIVTYARRALARGFFYKPRYEISNYCAFYSLAYLNRIQEQTMKQKKRIILQIYNFWLSCSIRSFILRVLQSLAAGL